MGPACKQVQGLSPLELNKMKVIWPNARLNQKSLEAKGYGDCPGELMEYRVLGPPGWQPGMRHVSHSGPLGLGARNLQHLHAAS